MQDKRFFLYSKRWYKNSVFIHFTEGLISPSYSVDSCGTTLRKYANKFGNSLGLRYLCQTKEQSPIMETLQMLFRQYVGKEPERVVPLTPAGSNRRYYRLSAAGTGGEESLVGVVGTSPEENTAFFTIASHLRQAGIRVPEVKAVSSDKRSYLQDDLGDTSLFSLLGQDCADALLEKTMRQLPAIQFKGAEGLDFRLCYPSPSMDRRGILWDLNYFKYCYLKATGLDFSEPALEDDFERLADKLLSEPFDTFMYRDFQSRNVMVKEGEPWFIDFQGGRRGPIYYDVASFLWQARAGFSDVQRSHLIDVYLEALQPFRPMEKSAFVRQLRYFILFRLLQVLGAYGFRGYFERKSHFLQSIPMALASLRKELACGYPELPYLYDVLQRVASQPLQEVALEAEGLTVEVNSFSYRSGIPDDFSGNGGGYVFDCRALNNPGRYEAYKTFTGKDMPVIDFLDSKDDMACFLSHVYALVDQAVERYLERGFHHLMVSFGCTGGQHRSVYAAEHLSQHLREKYPVHIQLNHRAQKKI